MCQISPDDSSCWMVIPASASIGTLASGYKEDNCIYVGIGILVASLFRRILRQGVSIGIPTGIHGEYEIYTWIGILIGIHGGCRVCRGIGIPMARY